jgi:autotransporter-associated beta strand protein
MIRRRLSSARLALMAGASGSLTVSNGHLVLTRANTYSGGTEVDDGVMLTLQHVNAAGTGSIRLDDDAALRIDVDVDGVFANALDADVGSRVTKTGSGAVTFDGLNFGDFDVDEGTAVFIGTTTFAGAQGLTIETDGRTDAFGTLVGDVFNEGVFRPGGAGVATNLSEPRGAPPSYELRFRSGKARFQADQLSFRDMVVLKAFANLL